MPTTLTHTFDHGCSHHREQFRTLSEIVWERHRKHVAIRGDKVSKWERGECRPTRLYREAYRALYNATDEELGFVQPQAEPPSPAPVPAVVTATDVEVIRDTLEALIASERQFGGAHQRHRQLASGWVRIRVSEVLDALQRYRSMRAVQDLFEAARPIVGRIAGATTG